MSSDYNQLALEAKGNDRKKVAALLKAVQPTLVKMVRATRMPRCDQEDAVQEVLITTLKCVVAYDPHLGDFENYLIRSISNQLTSFNSREQRHREREPLGLASVSEEELARDTHPEPQLADDLAILPVLHQAIVRDHYGVGMARSYSINQIAARRGMPNTRVREILRESVLKMRGAARC